GRLHLGEPALPGVHGGPELPTRARRRTPEPRAGNARPTSVVWRRVRDRERHGGEKGTGAAVHALRFELRPARVPSPPIRAELPGCADAAAYPPREGRNPQGKGVLSVRLVRRRQALLPQERRLSRHVS